jgi:hypothetical protein
MSVEWRCAAPNGERPAITSARRRSRRVSRVVRRMPCRCGQAQVLPAALTPLREVGSFGAQCGVVAMPGMHHSVVVAWDLLVPGVAPDPAEVTSTH